MRLLDERGRALANGLLRRPEILEEICADAARDDLGRRQLEAAMWLFASLAMHLETELALAVPTAAPPDDEGTRAEVADGIGDEYERWTIPKHAASSVG